MPPYKASPENTPEYHQERYQSLLENTPVALADRMASYLLAVAWSTGGAGASGDPQKPQYTAVDGSKPIKEADKTNPNPQVAQSQTAAANRGKSGWKPIVTATTKIVVPEKPGENGLQPDVYQNLLKEYENKKLACRQLDINLDCTAAAVLDGVWYFASNSLDLQDKHVTEMRKELALEGLDDIKYVIVDPFYKDRNLHAEMKIFKYLKSVDKLVLGVVIGVSKPCCPKCKGELDTWKAVYTSYHNLAPAANRWTDPGLGVPK